MYSLYYFPFRKHGGISIYIDLKKKKKEKSKTKVTFSVKNKKTIPASCQAVDFVCLCKMSNAVPLHRFIP